MKYSYDRRTTARVPLEFPIPEWDKFSKHLNDALLSGREIQRSLEKGHQYPAKAKAVGAVVATLLELRQDMLWVAAGTGDEVRTR